MLFQKKKITYFIIVSFLLYSWDFPLEKYELNGGVSDITNRYTQHHALLIFLLLRFFSFYPEYCSSYAYIWILLFHEKEQCLTQEGFDIFFRAPRTKRAALGFCVCALNLKATTKNKKKKCLYQSAYDLTYILHTSYLLWLIYIF